MLRKSIFNDTAFLAHNFTQGIFQTPPNADLPPIYANFFETRESDARPFALKTNLLFPPNFSLLQPQAAQARRFTAYPLTWLSRVDLDLVPQPSHTHLYSL